MAMPSGNYTVVRTNSALTGAITAIQVVTPANCAIQITRASASQGSMTASNPFGVIITEKSVAATVTSRTPDVLTDGMQASKCVGGTSATGIDASAEGTDATNPLWAEASNITGNGVLYLPIPEERIGIGPSKIIALKHSVAGAGNFNHVIVWIEYAY